MKQIVEFVLNLPAWLWITIVAHFLVLGTVAYLILLERKVASWVQDRIGPNRVGLGFGILPVLKNMHMFGLGQPLADGLKFIVKEDYAAKGVDVILFTLAPLVMIIVIIISIATVPMGGIHESVRHHTKQVDTIASVGTPAASQFPDADAKTFQTEFKGDYQVDGVAHQTWLVSYYTVPYRYSFQIADLNIGVLFILAVLSLSVYGVVIGGWASNNKYSFLGGLRATANMISYEIPLGLAVLCIVIMFGTLNLETIVEQQAGYWMGFIPAWNVFSQPLTFMMFLICIHAEANRAPFDMAEAEQELVGGYHTEYAGMRFALYYMSEYINMVTVSSLVTTLFLGGWVGIGNGILFTLTTSAPWFQLIGVFWFFFKTLAFLFFYFWIRATLPRIRYDQLMWFGWKIMLPLSVVNMLATALYVSLS